MNEERKEKRMKKREKTKLRLSAGRWKAGGVIAALTAALAVFAAMLQLEKNLLAAYEKETVYIAAIEIPKGEVITEDNRDVYFRELEIDSACIAESSLKDLGNLTGLAAKVDIGPGVILSDGMFEKMDDILSDMEEPVIAGFKADDLYQVAGGILRAGDRVHIYSVSEDKQTELIRGEAYIQSVFGQNGTQIENGDKVTAAQRINIYLDKADVETFYSELAEGTLRVVKICD